MKEKIKVKNIHIFQKSKKRDVKNSIDIMFSKEGVDKQKVLFLRNTRKSVLKDKNAIRNIQKKPSSDNNIEQECNDIATSEEGAISTISEALEKTTYQGLRLKTKYPNSANKIVDTPYQLQEKYKKYKIKGQNQELEKYNKNIPSREEYRNYQAGTKLKMLAFSNSKRNNGQSTQSIFQRVKGILKDKLGLGKEKFTSFQRTVVLYFLGILALILIPVVLVLAIVCNSPFAIFLPNTGTGETIMTVTSSYISDFNQEINELAEHPSNCDAAKIVYLNHEGDSSIPSNYYDIIAVYMVRYGIGNMATIVDDSSKENLKQVFNDMCIYTTKEKIEKQEDNGIETTKKILLIKVKLKTYQDMISYYQFSEEEIELLEMLMSPENRALFGSILEDENLENDMSSSTIEAVISNISKEEVKTVLNFALSKLGYPYSQAYRDSGKYYDCSSLTYYAWRSVGVNLTYEGANTAAQQAKLCNDKGYTVSYADIQPGDLIFYSFGYNGRYKNISHVAIYCGDGMLVDASYSQQKVVYRKVYSRENIVLIGRPSK